MTVSVKSLQKQLIAAVAMVLVAMIALGSSTYAWFAANTTVTANGMSATAQSDTVFLEIKGTSDGDTFSTTGKSTLAANLKPVHHDDLDDLGDITTVGKWWYAYSAKETESTKVEATKTSLTSTLDGYVAKVTYQVQLNNKSGVDTAYDLHVSSITLPENTGITAIIAGADGFVEYDATQASITPTVAISNEVSKTPQTITVYFYIDGENEYVRTNNISALTGAVTLNLAVYTTNTIV